MLDAVTDPDSPLYEGVPWWKLKYWPGKKVRFGGRPKLAAYLYYNLAIGDSFRLRDLRAALGDEAPDDAEHLNRRLRSLREQGWEFTSYMDQAGQEQDEYVLRAKGKRIWLGEKIQRKQISNAIRRQVFDRDLNRCVVCGAGRGEPYPGEPGTKARLTIGHRTAGARRGGASPDNLQTECARCNEPVGDTPPNPETLDEVMAAIKKLGPRDKELLLAWIEKGYRQRNKVDLAFDRVRRLSESEQTDVLERLREATQGH
jgi:hypothetical protein